MLVKVVLNKNLLTAVVRPSLGSNFVRTFSSTILSSNVDTLIQPQRSRNESVVNYGTITQPIFFQMKALPRYHSTISAETVPPTRVLDVDVVKKIMDELRSIDNNSDER